MSYTDKFLISEFYALEADRKLITEAIDNNQPIIIDCILQAANTLNRNGRIYPMNILKREVLKYMELVRERSAMGELDHPDSAIISLSNVSHIVTQAEWKGEVLHGKIQVAETPAGNILKGLLKSGFKLGISSRGVGSVKNQNGKDVVQEDFELIAFDVVSSPSTPGAYLFNEGVERKPGIKRLTEKDFETLKADKANGRFAGHSQVYQLSQNDFWKNK